MIKRFTNDGILLSLTFYIDPPLIWVQFWCFDVYFKVVFFLQTALPKFESIEKSYRQAYFEIWNFMCTFFCVSAT